MTFKHSDSNMTIVAMQIDGMEIGCPNVALYIKTNNVIIKSLVFRSDVVKTLANVVWLKSYITTDFEDNEHDIVQKYPNAHFEPDASGRKILVTLADDENTFVINVRSTDTCDIDSLNDNKKLFKHVRDGILQLF